jgi:excisionase family DNA binding protein
MRYNETMNAVSHPPLNPTQAGVYLGVSNQKVQRLIHSEPAFPAVKVSGVWLIDQDALAEWAERKHS